MPTYRCTAACKSCGTLSSPQEKTRLSDEHFFNAIDQASDNGYGLVVFTGGEATLARELLLSGIERATSRGLLTRLVTNGWWARSDVTARRRIAEFIDVGLDEINFSTGDEHARFVPLEHVVRGSCIAASSGLPVAIMVETVEGRSLTKDDLLLNSDICRVAAAPGSEPIRVLESPWMPLSPSEIAAYNGEAVNARNISSCTGCDSILSTTTVQADGTIGACCGIGLRLIPELNLGNISEISLADADSTAANDFLKRWIRSEGPERILAWAAEHDNSIAWEDMYAHRCQACMRIYTDPAVREVISAHHQEKMADVLFSEWLLYRYVAAGPSSTASEPDNI
jgi:pyruvate-formate lyase-activating enzyme